MEENLEVEVPTQSRKRRVRKPRTSFSEVRRKIKNKIRRRRSYLGRNQTRSTRKKARTKRS